MSAAMTPQDAARLLLDPTQGWIAEDPAYDTKCSTAVRVVAQAVLDEKAPGFATPQAIYNAWHEVKAIVDRKTADPQSVVERVRYIVREYRYAGSPGDAPRIGSAGDYDLNAGPCYSCGHEIDLRDTCHVCAHPGHNARAAATPEIVVGDVAQELPEGSAIVDERDIELGARPPARVRLSGKGHMPSSWTGPVPALARRYRVLYRAPEPPKPLAKVGDRIESAIHLGALPPGSVVSEDGYLIGQRNGDGEWCWTDGCSGPDHAHYPAVVVRVGWDLSSTGGDLS